MFYVSRREEPSRTFTSGDAPDLKAWRRQHSGPHRVAFLVIYILTTLIMTPWFMTRYCVGNRQMQYCDQWQLMRLFFFVQVETSRRQTSPLRVVIVHNDRDVLQRRPSPLHRPLISRRSAGPHMQRPSSPASPSPANHLLSCHNYFTCCCCCWLIACT